MIRGIDHLVIAVRDLAEASADYARAGFRVTPGGTHTGGKTHNALVTFADGSYFELIALTESRHQPDHAWFGSIEHWEGFVAFALRSDDLEGDHHRLAKANVITNGPKDGGRERPDGVAIAWRSFSLESVATPMLPFVIQDVTARELRVPGGDAAVHPLGVSGISAVTVVVGDLASAGAVYAALLGEGSAIGDLPAGVAAGLRFTAGSSTIDVVQPSGQETELGAQQFERGDNLYEALLPAPEGQADLLPISLTHGARLRLGTA